MAIEIEKKFLVINDDWKTGSSSEIYFQGYIHSGSGKTVRARIAGNRGYLTIKGKNSGISRMEFEYQIPLGDAEIMINELCGGSIIHKRRYRKKHAGFLWEIDEFYGDNEGLVVAEIELESVDQEFENPQWLGREVSDDGRYYNASLRLNPYKNWRENTA